MSERLVNVQLETMWMELVIALFKALSQNFLGGPQEIHKTRGQFLPVFELGIFQYWS